MNGETRILQPGEMEAPIGEIPYLSLPGRDLFARRAGRLRQLSEGHPLGGYLAFLALIADAQQAALDRFAPLPLPSPAEQALCREHGMPLLAARTMPRDPAWLEGLMTILRQMSEAALPEAALGAIAGLLRASAAGLEQRADRILAGDLAGTSPGELPLVAAGLQVYWVQLASSLGEEAFGRSQEAGVCPVCGSFPVVGVVLSGGKEQGLRYLCCSLCSSQWHLVRVTCSSCTSNGGISYYNMEGSNGAVKAESCDDCGSYLKLLYLEKDGQMEAVADDLATLALDLLMDGMGKMRGPNLLFHPGATSPAADTKREPGA